MALLRCPDCGSAISDAAPACIHCGRPTGDAKEAEPVVGWSARKKAGLAICAVLFLGFCFALGLSGVAETEPTTAAFSLAGDADTKLTDGRVYITTTDVGDQWPLTVPGGYLSCERGHAVVFRQGGVDYAVNGSARALRYAPINPIWKDSPTPEYGPKLSIGPLIDRGLALCD